MNFDEVLLAHSRWKSRLKKAIENQEVIDAVAVAKDDQCELGKWLAEEGKKYAGYPQFSNLKAKHTRFHVAVGEVVGQATRVPPDKALDLIAPLNSEFGRASTDCINAISELRKAIGAK